MIYFKNKFIIILSNFLPNTVILFFIISFKKIKNIIFTFWNKYLFKE